MAVAALVVTAAEALAEAAEAPEADLAEGAAALAAAELAAGGRVARLKFGVKFGELAKFDAFFFVNLIKNRESVVKFGPRCRKIRSLC